MSKVGIIGLGSMGGMLLNGFIASGALDQRDILLSTRTKSKLDHIHEQWPEVSIANDNADVARQARHVFICVKPADVKGVLEEIQPALSADTHIVSIAGSVTLASMQSVTGGAVSRVIPSVTSEVSAGVTLVCHSPDVPRQYRDFLEKLLGAVGHVKTVPEGDLDMATELTSCMPGFIAAVFSEMVEAAMRRPEALERPLAEELVKQTLLGTARLLAERGMGFDETVRRVATPGGITQEGVKALHAGLPAVFDEMFDKTMEKRRAVRERVNKLY